MKPLGENISAQTTEPFASAAESALCFDTKKLLHNLHTALLIIDPETFEIRWTNASAEHLLGLPSCKIMGQNCHDVVCSQKNGICPFIDLKRNIHHHEYEIERENGVRIPVLKTVQRMRFKGKDVFVESLTDVSEQRLTHQRLCESEKRFHTMTDLLPEAIFETDSDFKITYLNQAGLKMFGYTAQDVQNGLDVLDIFLPNEQLRVLQNLILRKRGKLEKGLEYDVIRKDGSIFPAFCHPRLVFRNNVFAGIRGIVTDISEHRRIERLQEDKKLAENINQTKNMFLQNMTHELRTPLTPIIGFTDIILESADLSEEQKEYLHIIKQRGHDLLRLINGIVDVIKVESDKINLSNDTIDIRSLLDDVYNFFEASIQDMNIRYKLEISPDIPDYILIDPSRFQQILLNLVDNAVKFSAKGTVQVFADYDTSGDTPQIRIRVRDTGPGIRPDEQDCIFQPFFKITDAPNHALKGTGLGLSICQRLAKRMGGYLSLSSTLGEGSEFTFAVNAPPA